MGSLVSNVAAKFAFFPPQPPTYNIQREGAKITFARIRSEKNIHVHLLDTKRGNRIVAMYWRHPYARFTVLYSHGNAADLGQMYDLFVQLRKHLRINLMAYVSALHLYI